MGSPSSSKATLRNLLSACLALFSSTVVAGLLQLWFTPWSHATFVKIIVSLGAVMALILGYWAYVRESIGVAEMKSGQLDE